MLLRAVAERDFFGIGGGVASELSSSCIGCLRLAFWTVCAMA